ncbi:MAG: hypothetical protein AB7H43_14035, partial [Acidimicrobiia bacterium]
YDSALYEDLYDGWWTLDVAVTAHSSNAVRSDRTGRVERLWSNRPLDVGLFADSGAARVAR